MRTPTVFVSLALLLTLLVDVSLAHAAEGDVPAPEGPPSRIVRRSKPFFGTVVEILANVDNDETVRAAPTHFEAAFSEMRRVETLLADDGVESAIARINASAGGEPVVIDPETFAVLTELQRIANLSAGAFDVTSAVLNNSWRFDDDTAGKVATAGAAPSSGAATDAPPAATPAAPSPRTPVPSNADIDKAKALVGYRDLELTAASRTARLKRAGEKIGVRPVNRAYALDRAAAVLEGRGLTNFILTAGGDLVVRGKKGDHPWMLGLQDPRAPGYFATLTATPGAVMTTGDYEDFFFDGGVRYHHVIDPRTGRPANGCRSVTVVGSDAISAEALSRAVFALGAREDAALVERLKGAEAVIVTNDNRVVVTKGLRAAVQYRPPTDGP